jgi:DNA-binding NarL/FixJ family response regulator
MQICMLHLLGLNSLLKYIVKGVDMVGLGNINLKVLLMDTDFYALQAVNSYLAWDRRTRVVFMAQSPEQMWEQIDNIPVAELPDVVVMDVSHFWDSEKLKETITNLKQRINGVRIVCLAQFIRPVFVQMASDAQVMSYFLKQEVRLQIAWAICYSLDHDFTVTPGIAHACEQVLNSRETAVTVLPKKRDYPELTDRIRQAMTLCVVEGMPAHLAADEMGISLHTIRGYVKEGYRILESHDGSEYPVDMTPQERAFMRFTALTLDDENNEVVEQHIEIEDKGKE